MDTIRLQPIGTIRTPFTQAQGTPIQPGAGKGVEGRVEIDAEYLQGIQDLEGFSHLILIYHFHRSEGYSLLVTPYLDTVQRGLFSTRAPRRPNPIGLSVVQLVRIEGNLIHIRDLDILDGTPLLDIKPYVPEFAARDTIRTGWLQDRVGELPETRADSRFHE